MVGLKPTDPWPDAALHIDVWPDTALWCAGPAKRNRAGDTDVFRDANGFTDLWPDVDVLEALELPDVMVPVVVFAEVPYESILEAVVPYDSLMEAVVE